MKYPAVLPESETLKRAHAGMSIARFGDGELKIALGRDAKSQRHHPALQAWLAGILAKHHPSALVCIPNIETLTPKAEFWRPFARAPYVGLYDLSETYGSAFITRPDSAPWIDSPGYWQSVIDLWRKRDVVLVRGSSKSLTASDLAAASSVAEVIAPRQHAWTGAESLFSGLRRETRRVILCLGATATVLAYRLAREGVHAIDLGHVGMFLRKEGRFDRESFPA